MEEFSIEQKAQRYDKALEKAKNYHSPETECNIRIAMENLFPELAESEDEKIRKEMIEILKNEAHEFPSSVIANKSISWIAWLEKKGEQKSAEWSDEDNEHIKSIISTIECSKAQFPNSPAVLEAYNSDLIWLKSLRPQSTWKLSNELPHWKKITIPNHDVTGFNSENFTYKGYYINYIELFEKLPKDD